MAPAALIPETPAIGTLALLMLEERKYSHARHICDLACKRAANYCRHNKTISARSWPLLLKRISCGAEKPHSCCARRESDNNSRRKQWISFVVRSPFFSRAPKAANRGRIWSRDDELIRLTSFRTRFLHPQKEATPLPIVKSLARAIQAQATI